MLPFDSPLTPEPLQIQGLTIPRYGSLTVSELLLLRSIASDTESLTFDGELGQAILEWHLRCVLTSILIISRADPAYTLQQVQALPETELNQAVEFLLNERDRWGESKGKPAEGKLKEIDWSDLYWQMQRSYPHEPRFSRENFGNCPIALIESALESSRQAEIERLAAESRAIANVGVFVAASKGVKKPEARHFSPYENLLFVQNAVEEVKPEVAASFMRLHEKGRTPEWLLEFVDLDTFRASASTLDAT